MRYWQPCAGHWNPHAGYAIFFSGAGESFSRAETACFASRLAVFFHPLDA